MTAWARLRTSRSLYERANSYNYEAVKIFNPANAKKPVYAPYVEISAMPFSTSHFGK
jgi:hypothetical protein